MLTKITDNLYVFVQNINWIVLDKEKDICRFTEGCNGSCYECSYEDGTKIVGILGEIGHIKDIDNISYDISYKASEPKKSVKTKKK